MESKWVPVEERNGQMENAISVLAMLSSALGIRQTSEVVAMGIGALIHNNIVALCLLVALQSTTESFWRKRKGDEERTKS